MFWVTYWRRLPVRNNGKQDSVRVSYQTVRYEDKVQIYGKWSVAFHNDDIGRMDRLGQ